LAADHHRRSVFGRGCAGAPGSLRPAVGRGTIAAAPALVVGMPWSLILGQLDLDADNLAVSTALVVLAIGINAGLLWWWALSRKR